MKSWRFDVLDNLALPSHVGIIMDGNGRWAKERGSSRTSGHQEGLEAAKRIVTHASNTGINILSLYVFSTENWRRAEQEVNLLMNLIKTHLRQQYDFYRENGLRIVHSGNLEGLPLSVRREIRFAEEKTAQLDGMRINLLINYGGRDEIVRAVRRLVEDDSCPDSITEAQFAQYFDHPEIPDLDLMIRTGGEVRLSNFLLWQAAYAEMYFSDVYWPDWTSEHLDAALVYYQSRRRRFGKIADE